MRKLGETTTKRIRKEGKDWKNWRRGDWRKKNERKLLRGEAETVPGKIGKGEGGEGGGGGGGGREGSKEVGMGKSLLR